MTESFEPFGHPLQSEAQMLENEEARPLFTERVEKIATTMFRRVRIEREPYDLVWNDLYDQACRDLTPDEQEKLPKAVAAAIAERDRNKQTPAAKQVMSGRIPRGSTKEERLRAIYAGLSSSGPMEADRRRSDTLFREAEERELNQE